MGRGALPLRQALIDQATADSAMRLSVERHIYLHFTRTNVLVKRAG
ncbi:hypothetical protein PD5205_02543 [Xanthomonas fragariae]|uniref:Uncharacterized protein n=1 Tax=Xanthomonas fragariae TaxID=48664 RepID=A0A1Y6GX60_9XANT|nr:hypothetical protein NBC2815_02540 [Xanthomonas fragariae]SMQ98701.1 hypothetical protein PD885_01451 [Xanthomonas fragariae]SMR03834.1 hypothetical protein PD5205_02543 [Xanthomonas fragariae]